ncbi:MAG: hypothetical protein LUC98_08140 [Lachnospiraceae bacterium]|nr:hypothetical protein [Lachnospiraceae bacterium]
MLNKLIYSRKSILVPLLNTLKNSDADTGVTRIRQLETELLQITEQRQTLQRLMAAGYLDQVIYTEQKNELTTRADACRLEIETVQNTSGKASEQIVELQHLLSFAEHTAMQTVFDETLFTEYVDHIVLLDRETAAFHLKCGLVLQERL